MIQADLGGGTSAVLLSLADLTIAPLLRWPDGRCPDAVSLHSVYALGVSPSLSPC